MMKCAGLLLATVLMAATAQSQEARRAGSDANVRLQQQLQQLASERTVLQSENARLKEVVSKLEKEAGAFSAEKAALTRRAGVAEDKVNRAAAGQQSASSRLEATEARLNEVVARYKELAEQLRAVETERNALARQAAADNQQLKSCAQKNVQLAGIANEALDRYERKGCFGALAQAEPFTRLKRVEVENAVDEYRQQLNGLHLPKASGNNQ